ncbi:MAG: hypothetical protein D6811_03270 [Alphaproteobacteria bacterium]|nr:MAG: hypothetical protein D6811_03270 [Alphaproteobacteria bacterium]
MAICTGANLGATYSALGGDTPAPGDVFFGTGGKVYKFVRYREGTGALDIAAGDVVYYTDAAGGTSFEVTADTSDASGQEIGAGVAATAVTTDGDYFGVQIKGPATVAQTSGGTAGDGDPLTCVGAADKALTKAAESDTAAVYKPVVAFAVDASAKTVICDFPW